MIDDRAFRDALGRFASGVTVATTEAGGLAHAMTASAFTSVSLVPPQVLLGVHDINRFHEAVIESGRWAVSILNEAGESAASHFAVRGRDLITQFDSIPHHRGEHGLILIDDALAWLECETVNSVVAGDHTMLIGKVLSAKVNTNSDNPLLYYRSEYGSITRLGHGERSDRA